jgi:hypothetical protein
MGLSCEKIADLVPIWAGADCAAAQERIGRLIDDKQAEIKHRIAELRAFAAQLDAVRVALAATPPPSTCRSDLSCCVPEGPTAPSNYRWPRPAAATGRSASPVARAKDHRTGREGSSSSSRHRAYR